MDDRLPLVVNADGDDLGIGAPPEDQPVKCTPECWSIPSRYILAIMMFLGFFCAFAQRMVFNIALVAMVNFTQPDNNDTSDDCPANTLSENTTSVPQIGDFHWDSTVQSLLLGAFFYGYPISQVPFGYLAERYGGKYIFAFTGLTTGILSLLIPLAAWWNPYALVTIRAVQGLCQGSIYPTIVAMWSRWAPPAERNNMYAFVNAGATLGTVVAMVVAGVLCQSTFLGGWPSTFYLFGGLSILWSLAWMFFAYDTPAVHPRITPTERKYIEDATESLDSVKYSTPPWRSIVTSIPIWAIFCVTCTDNFGFYVTFNCMPLFMKQVLRFDMSQNGFLSAMPYIVQFPLSIYVGWFADCVRQKGYLSVVNIRRSATILGELMPGVFLLAVGFVDCNKMAAVGMLVLSLTFNSFTLAGAVPALFDIAPLYAGTLMGILNGIANVCGFISPMVIAKLTNNSGDQMEWRTVFFISAAVYAFGAIVFCALITDKEQSWARERRTNTDRNEAQTTLPEAISS